MKMNTRPRPVNAAGRGLHVAGVHLSRMLPLSPNAPGKVFQLRSVKFLTKEGWKILFAAAAKKRLKIIPVMLLPQHPE